MSLDFGTLPEWLSGIGTVGTLLIAVRVLSRERAERRADELERRAREWEREARQARLVTYWVPEEGKYGTPQVIVSNASENPVFDFSILLHREVIGSRRSIPPGQVEFPVNDAVEARELVLAFTDAEGRRWKRREHRLAKADPPPRSGAPAWWEDLQVSLGDHQRERRSRWWRW
jgi:hypothetical protein